MQVGAINDVALKRKQPVAQVQRASVCYVGIDVLLKQFFHRHSAALLATHATASKDVSHQAALPISLHSIAEVARTQVNAVRKDQNAFVVHRSAGAVA